MVEFLRSRSWLNRHSPRIAALNDPPLRYPLAPGLIKWGTKVEKNTFPQTIPLPEIPNG